jgi:hypothetical protein
MRLLAKLVLLVACTLVLGCADGPVQPAAVTPEMERALKEEAKKVAEEEARHQKASGANRPPVDRATEEERARQRGR